MKRYEYNPETMEYETREVPKVLYVAQVFVAVILTLGFIALFVWLYLGVFKLELPKTAIIKAEQTRLDNRLTIMQRRIELYDNTLSGIEERDDHIYRSIFGMDTLVVNKSDTISGLCSRMENIEKRIASRSESLDSIALVASSAGDMISHVPAVPPVLPKKGAYRISSAFGRRIDPIRKVSAFHEGIDFAAPRGTFVYATADGVVESVHYSSRGYGNEIVLNHGFGYKTRYAHLRTIDMVVGMTVRRGDIVGTVGNTGKSTGPHLHYEVIYMKKRVNPYYYMDLDMSADEFQTMVSERGKDSPYTVVKSSSNELLRRRK